MNKARILSALMAFAIIATPVISNKANNDSKVQNYQITADAAKHTGWVKSKGYWYYYDKNGKMIKDKQKKIDGYYYYFDKKGRMLEGQWHDNHYFFNESGVMVTGCAPTGKNLDRWDNFDSNGNLIEISALPWVLYQQQDVYISAGRIFPTNNRIKKGEIVLVTDLFKNKDGELWGEINYENKFRGCILMIDSKGNALGSDNKNVCYDVISKKFCINKQFVDFIDNNRDELLKVDYQF